MFDILLGTSSLLRLQSPKFRPRKFRTARNNFVPHHRHVTLIVCSLTWIGSRVHLWKRRLINRKTFEKIVCLEKFSKIIETFYFMFDFWKNEKFEKFFHFWNFPKTFQINIFYRKFSKIFEMFYFTFDFWSDKFPQIDSIWRNWYKADIWLFATWSTR